MRHFDSRPGSQLSSSPSATMIHHCSLPRLTPCQRPAKNSARAFATARGLFSIGIWPADLIRTSLVAGFFGRETLGVVNGLCATLDWSYDLLSEREKTVLCRLSVFVGPFTLEAGQVVASEADRHGWQVIDVIPKLVDKSLLLVSSRDDQSLYRLLDTTRAYAAVKLAGREEENAIARRHALYHAERLAAIRPGSPPRSQPFSLLATDRGRKSGAPVELFAIGRHDGWRGPRSRCGAPIPELVNAERMPALVSEGHIGAG